jgi:hypothetical protein
VAEPLVRPYSDDAYCTAEHISSLRCERVVFRPAARHRATLTGRNASQPRILTDGIKEGAARLRWSKRHRRDPSR